jgi:hypothetical protein
MNTVPALSASPRTHSVAGCTPSVSLGLDAPAPLQTGAHVAHPQYTLRTTARVQMVSGTEEPEPCSLMAEDFQLPATLWDLLPSDDSLPLAKVHVSFQVLFGGCMYDFALIQKLPLLASGRAFLCFPVIRVCRWCRWPGTASKHCVRW